MLELADIHRKAKLQSRGAKTSCPSVWSPESDLVYRLEPLDDDDQEYDAIIDQDMGQVNNMACTVHLQRHLQHGPLILIGT